VIGWVAEHAGANAAIWIGGLISLAAALLAVLWQLRHDKSRLRLRIAPLPRLYVVPSDTGRARTVVGV
jgi:hypothetical protein